MGVNENSICLVTIQQDGTEQCEIIDAKVYEGRERIEKERHLRTKSAAEKPKAPIPFDLPLLKTTMTTNSLTSLIDSELVLTALYLLSVYVQMGPKRSKSLILMANDIKSLRKLNLVLNRSLQSFPMTTMFKLRITCSHVPGVAIPVIVNSHVLTCQKRFVMAKYT